jgi:hypothetical protein
VEETGALKLPSGSIGSSRSNRFFFALAQTIDSLCAFFDM